MRVVIDRGKIGAAVQERNPLFTCYLNGYDFDGGRRRRKYVYIVLQDSACIFIPAWGPLLVITKIVAKDGDFIGEGVSDDGLVSDLSSHVGVFR